MKHLLFILDFYAPHRGGIENVFENIISRLLKKGYQISLVTSHFDSTLKKEEHLWNLHIYRVGKGRKDFFFKSFWKGRSILKQYSDIESIHSSTYTSAMPASFLWYFFKKKNILTVHEIFWTLWKIFKPWYSRWIYQLFEWMSFKFTHDEYHCVSLYTLNSIRLYYGIPDKKLHLIYNGVDSIFWNKDNVSKKVIEEWKNKYERKGKYLMLYYGHSGKSKGIDYLVEAIPEIIKNNPDGILIFNLIDAKRDHLMKKKIKEQAKKSWSPKQIIIFDGWEQDKLRELVACVDVIIAPSLAEGFGSVHSEACAMKKTLITTQVAAIPEVVSGKVKFISSASSSAIVKWIEEVRTEYLQEIPEKKFNWDENVKNIERLY